MLKNLPQVQIYYDLKMKLVQLIYVRNILRGVIAAWQEPMLSRRGQLMVIAGMRRMFIVVWSTNLPVELLILVLVLEVKWSITFDIFLSSLSGHLLDMALLQLFRFLLYPWHDRLAPTWCSLVYIHWLTQPAFKDNPLSLFSLFLGTIDCRYLIYFE